MFRGALDEEIEPFEFSPEHPSGESTSELEVHRFDDYELLKGKDGKPIELGRGAMGVTYKAFDATSFFARSAGSGVSVTRM